MSKVQIEDKLFWDICYYFAHADTDDWDAQDIMRQLDAKIDTMYSRMLYTKYKRMPLGADREAARRAYIEHRGILPDYQTDVEYTPPEPPDGEM